MQVSRGTIIPPQRGSVTAEISEVFSSLQGEGLYLGKRQIFVRFGRCNMLCAYCDEVEKMQAGRYRDRTVTDVLGSVCECERRDAGHHAVSLTGGEPLLYADFLKFFLPELKRAGFLTYLETNGTLPRALEENLAHIDIIAMDMKPPSSTQNRPFWEEHENFLDIARRKDLFVKIVVTGNTEAGEIMKSVDLIHRVSASIPLLLQPETEMTGINMRALQRIRTELIGPASAKLRDVRVIPQMHKIWDIR